MSPATNNAERIVEGEYGPNLISAWLDYELAAGYTWAEAINRLNLATDRNHKRGRVYEWLNGKGRAPAVDAIAYMVELVAPREVAAVAKVRNVRERTARLLLAVARLSPVVTGLSVAAARRGGA